MKGMVFTEFIELVEEKFGFSTADQIIQDAHPASGGAYTTVGLYDDAEMFALVQALSERSGIPVVDLLKIFGEHLFGRFFDMFPQFVDPAPDVFHLLSSVHEFIHVEVHKLYPDARLPAVICKRIDDSTLVANYKSHRPLGDFAEGLIRGAIKHFGETIDIQRRDIDTAKSEVEFTLVRIS